MDCGDSGEDAGGSSVTIWSLLEEEAAICMGCGDSGEDVRGSAVAISREGLEPKC